MWRVAVFDFDGTLADTSPIVDLREQSRRTGIWDRYFESVAHCDPVALPEGGTVMEFLLSLARKGVRVCIASRSPRFAVDNWLSAQHIENQDIAVFGAIGTDRREGVKKVLGKVSASMSFKTTVFVDDEPSGWFVARQLNIMSASPGIVSDSNVMPDGWILEAGRSPEWTQVGRLCCDFPVRSRSGYMVDEQTGIISLGRYLNRDRPDKEVLRTVGDITQIILGTVLNQYLH